jgi:general secretion pathway protein A
VLLLSGPNSVGKSALVGRWMRSLESRLFCPVCLTQATLSGTAILSALATKLGKPASCQRQRNLQFIEEALGELERRILVVILDEAQNYSQPSLEEVRLLLGLNLPEQPAFALILIGDEYLLASLKLRNQRALYSRLACQISLSPWSPSQCTQYLSAGLAAVGLSASAIEPAASELLAGASAGLPRSLCLLARAAWIAAATEKAQRISPSHVQAAFQQVPCVPGLLAPATAAEP